MANCNVFETTSAHPRIQKIEDAESKESVFPAFIEQLVSGTRVHIHKDGRKVSLFRWNGEPIVKKEYENIAFDFWEMSFPDSGVFDGVIREGVFYCSDILNVDGESLADFPLYKRKELLAKINFAESTKLVDSKIAMSESDIDVDSCIIKPFNSTYPPDSNGVIEWYVYKYGEKNE